MIRISISPCRLEVGPHLNSSCFRSPVHRARDLCEITVQSSSANSPEIHWCHNIGKLLSYVHVCVIICICSGSD